MVTVTITDADYELAIKSGTVRHETLSRSKQSSMPVIFAPEEHLIQNIRSTAAEIAVARYLNREWLGAQYGGPLGYDVAPNIEVRTRPQGKGLYIKDREIQPGRWQKKPGDLFILVWQNDDDFKRFDIIGGLQLDYAWRASDPWRKDGKLWGWQVPHDHLWRIEKIKERFSDH